MGYLEHDLAVYKLNGNHKDNALKLMTNSMGWDVENNTQSLDDW